MIARPSRPSLKRSTPRRAWVLLLVLAAATASAVMTAQALERFPVFRPLISSGPDAVAPPNDPGQAGVGGERPGTGGDTGSADAPAAQHGSIERQPPSAVGDPGLTVPVLLYHYIRPNPEPRGAPGWDLSVAPEEFARQMAYAHSAGIHTVSVADVIRALAGGPKLPPKSVVLTFDDGYADFATTAAPILEREHLIATDYVVSGFVGRPNYMTEAQVRDVAARGMVIGAHTVHHAALAKIPPEAVPAEIRDSKTVLQQLLGHPVDDFAYPYGDYNAGVITQVVAAGFRDAVTTDSGTTQYLDRRFQLRRTRVGAGDTVAVFARKAMLPAPPPEAESAPVSLPSGVPVPPTAPPAPVGQSAPAAPSPTPLPPEPSTLIIPMPAPTGSPSPGATR